MSSSSMTGFGRTTFEWEGIEYLVEIKSLNGKLLDLQIKAAEPWAVLDSIAYKAIQQRLVRGKISLQVWAAPRSLLHSSDPIPSDEKPPLLINTPILEALREQWLEWSGNETAKDQDPLLDGALFGRLVAAHPMIFKKGGSEERLLGPGQITKSPENNNEAIKAYLTALETAIQDCINHRLAEGAATNAALRQYLDEIRLGAEEIRKIDTVKGPLIRKKIENFWVDWNDRLGRDGNLSLSPDPLRLEQELLYYLEKKDIAEELVRLRQHLVFALEVLDSQGEQGRKLGFVAQEIGRELNTIGSKVSDFEIQKRIVLSKEILEKIKEQSLNLL